MLCKVVETILVNRPWSPIGLWDVEAHAFSRRATHRWLWGRFQVPGRFLVLIPLRSWMDPRTVVRLEGLSELNSLAASSLREPDTFRIVAQCLNQVPYRVPQINGKACKTHVWNHQKSTLANKPEMCCAQFPPSCLLSTSNIEILERFQSKALRMIVDVPRYVPNTVIWKDLHTPTDKEEIRRYSSQSSARLSAHPNGLIVNLIGLPDNRRLRRLLPNYLPARFLV
jgi:hypothetical protein